MILFRGSRPCTHIFTHAAWRCYSHNLEPSAMLFLNNCWGEWLAWAQDGQGRAAPGLLATLRSHTFKLTGIFLNLACHTVDTISKINLWFTAHAATLAFVKMGKLLFLLSSVLCFRVWSTVWQNCKFINQTWVSLVNRNCTKVDRYVITPNFCLIVFLVAGNHDRPMLN